MNVLHLEVWHKPDLKRKKINSNTTQVYLYPAPSPPRSGPETPCQPSLKKHTLSPPSPCPDTPCQPVLKKHTLSQKVKKFYSKLLLHLHEQNFLDSGSVSPLSVDTHFEEAESNSLFCFGLLSSFVVRIFFSDVSPPEKCPVYSEAFSFNS